MGNGFDISKITGKLRDLAERADFMNRDENDPNDTCEGRKDFLDKGAEWTIFQKMVNDQYLGENAIFKNKVSPEEMEQIKTQFNEIMGFFATQETSDPKPAGNVVKDGDPATDGDDNNVGSDSNEQSKKEKKISNKNLKEFIMGEKGLLRQKEINTLDKAMEALRAKVNSSSDNKVYKDSLKKMETYAQKAKESNFKSKEDIEALKVTLEALEGYDEDLAEYVLAFCEKEQIQREADEITKMFLSITSENYSTRLDTLEAQLKAKGKWGTSYYEKAFDYFEENVMPQMMSRDIQNTLVGISGDALLEKEEKLLDNEDAIKAKIRDAHTKDIESLNKFLTELKEKCPDLSNVTQAQYDILSGKTKIMLGDMERYKIEGSNNYNLSEFNVEPDKLKDKKFNRAIKDNQIFIDVAVRRGVVLNKRQDLKHVTKAQFEELPPVLQVLLIENGYLKDHTITDETTGEVYYNFTDLRTKEEKESGENPLKKGLSELIEYRSGADFRVNIDTKSSKDSELEKVRDEFHQLFNKEITNDELEALIEYCSYEVYDKDHELTISKVARALLNGAASGAVAGGVTAARAEIVVNYDPHDYNIHINNVLSENIDVAALEAAGITVETLVEIVTDPTNITIDYAQSLLKSIAVGAIAGAAVGLVMKALHTWLIGNDVGAERSCISLNDYDNTNPRYTNYDQFVAYVKSNGDYEKLKKALEVFKPEEGTDPKAPKNWNHEAFFNTLRIDAGLGSRMNPEECAGRIYKKIEVPPPPEQPEEQQSAEIATNCETEAERIAREAENERIVAENEDSEKKRPLGSATWDEILALYPDNCLIQAMGSRKNAIRALKIAQGITDGDYSLERIKRLVELSYKRTSANIAALEAEQGFTWSTARNHIDYYQPEMKFPRSLVGCTRGEITENSLRSSASVGQMTAEQAQAAKRHRTAPGRSAAQTREARDCQMVLEIKDSKGNVTETVPVADEAAARAEAARRKIPANRISIRQQQ